MLVQTSQGQSGSAHVVVLGNEKGGSGKSTTALHVAVALLKVGQRVATNRFVRFNDTMGQERLGSDLTIAVDPADVPMMRSAVVRSIPASARPAMRPSCHALPAAPAPARTRAVRRRTWRTLSEVVSESD